MNIDRHNYEEFFILYLDNELSEKDRRQVEDFAQANTDLQEELNLLLQSKLSPDMEIVLEDKESLLKKLDPAGINLSNYEEWFLLYTDHELNNDQQKAVEKFVDANPAFRQELLLFRQTRIEADSNIVFPNKELLYRKETKTRVIGFRVWRVAAAIILLIGLSTSVYMLVENKNRQKPEGIARSGSKTTTPVNNVTEQASTADTNIKETTNEQQQSSPTEMASADQQPHINHEIKSVGKETNKHLVKENIVVNNPIAINKNEGNKAITEDYSNSSRVTGNSPIAMADPLTNKKEDYTETVVTSENAPPSNIIQASAPLTEKDLADVNQSGKKNKFRGFFRKVTRTIEKTTNIKATDDEDRLLLAGLAIKL